MASEFVCDLHLTLYSTFMHYGTVYVKHVAAPDSGLHTQWTSSRSSGAAALSATPLWHAINRSAYCPTCLHAMCQRTFLSCMHLQACQLFVCQNYSHVPFGLSFPNQPLAEPRMKQFWSFSVYKFYLMHQIILKYCIKLHWGYHKLIWCLDRGPTPRHKCKYSKIQKTWSQVFWMILNLIPDLM